MAGVRVSVRWVAAAGAAVGAVLMWAGVGLGEVLVTLAGFLSAVGGAALALRREESWLVRAAGPLMLALFAWGLVVKVHPGGGRGGGGPAPAAFAAAGAQDVARVAGFLRPGLRLEGARVAPSRAHASARFLAAAVRGPGAAPGAVGVWLLSGPEGGAGLTLAVDAWAKGLSAAPDASRSDAAATMADPPAADLQRFVESQIR